jgi:fructose/tagatose bisphosphate aldolase
VYHVVVAVNTTVEGELGVFGCDEQQVLRVVVDVVEQLSPVVAAAVGADVDVLFSWWLFLRVLCT